MAMLGVGTVFEVFGVSENKGTGGEPTCTQSLCMIRHDKTDNKTMGDLRDMGWCKTKVLFPIVAPN